MKATGFCRFIYISAFPPNLSSSRHPLKTILTRTSPDASLHREAAAPQEASVLIIPTIKQNGNPFAVTLVYIAFKALKRFIEACSVGRSEPQNY